MSDLFEAKPNPQSKWTEEDLNNYKNLEKFVRSNSDFIIFEEKRSAERKVQFEKERDRILYSLNQNLSKLNEMLRENFTIDEFSAPIKESIKAVQSVLQAGDGFEIEVSERILAESTNTIEVISKNAKNFEILDEKLVLYEVELNEILRSNFGTEQGSQAASLLERIGEAKSVAEKDGLNKEITDFLEIDNSLVERESERNTEKSNSASSEAVNLADGSNNQIANSSMSQNPDPQIEKEREDARNMNLEIEAQWGKNIKLSAFSDDDDLYLNSVMMEKMKSKYNIYSDQQIRYLNLIYDACNIIRTGDRFKSRDEKKTIKLWKELYGDLIAIEGEMQVDIYTYPRATTNSGLINSKYDFLVESGGSTCLMRDVRMYVEDFRCVIGPLGNCLISQNENVAFFTSSIVKSKNED